MSKRNMGPSFDDLLKEDGIYEETRDIAVKRVIAWQIAEAMKKEHITKSKMAERMNTSRPADRAAARSEQHQCAARYAAARGPASSAIGS